jgi:hypothetical protein
MAHQIEKVADTFAVPAGVVPPPLIGNQRFVLFNIAHERQVPVSAKPAFRLLGVFETEDEARAMVPDSPPISYFVSPTHRFVPLVSGPDVETTQAVASIVALHEAVIQKNNKDFQDMVEKKREGTTGQSITSLRARSARTRIPRQIKEIEGAKPCPPVTGDRCLAGQSFAVIVMLQDIRPASLSGDAPLEPLVAVLHAAGSVQDAEAYCKFTASREYPNNNAYVVDMYKWLHPEHVDLRAVASENANEHVTAIANKKRTEKAKIAELSAHPECIVEVTGRPEDSRAGTIDQRKDFKALSEQLAEQKDPAEPTDPAEPESVVQNLE